MMCFVVKDLSVTAVKEEFYAPLKDFASSYSTVQESAAVFKRSRISILDDKS